MKKMIIPVAAALLFATAGQAQMAAVKQTPAATNTKITTHKSAASAATVTPAAQTSTSATATGSTAIRRKHHHKVSKATAKKSK